MTIVFRYTAADGTHRLVMFENNEDAIDLSDKGMVSIDLSPLFCASLQIIGLSEFANAPRIG